MKKIRALTTSPPCTSTPPLRPLLLGRVGLHTISREGITLYGDGTWYPATPAHEGLVPGMYVDFTQALIGLWRAQGSHPEPSWIHLVADVHAPKKLRTWPAFTLSERSYPTPRQGIVMTLSGVVSQILTPSQASTLRGTLARVHSFSPSP